MFIQKKTGLLKNLMIVATRTPTIRVRAIDRFKRNAARLDPEWALPEFTAEKISKASIHWSKECVRAARNADKLRREHLPEQKVAMIDKSEKKVTRKHRIIQARLKKPRTQLTYVVQADDTTAVGQEVVDAMIQKYNSVHFQQARTNGATALPRHNGHHLGHTEMTDISSPSTATFKLPTLPSPWAH